MTKRARNALEKHAVNLGFDSAQAYIRFIAKAVADGRQFNLGEDNWGQPSPAAAQRLNRAAEQAKKDQAAGKLKSFNNSKDALEYLNNLK